MGVARKKEISMVEAHPQSRTAIKKVKKEEPSD